ncbi:MAG: Rieske (2Fe-2S) protein [Actinomycetales bacterium]
MWHLALPVADLDTVQYSRVLVDDRTVLIARDAGQVLAVNDTCPHRGASLSEGLLRDGCITCPAHLWRFSLRDGAKQGDPRTSIATYPTRVVDDMIEVDLPVKSPQRTLRETLLAHARGEEAL